MAHTARFVPENSFPGGELERWFFDNDYSYAALSNRSGELVLNLPEDLNENFIKLKAAEYYLHSVKRVAHKNIVVATWLYDGGSKADRLADAFEGVRSGGFSAAIKKECIVCRKQNAVCCPSCRVAHYCSSQCRISDYNTHREWCEAPKYYAEAFLEGINKVRAAIYKRKVLNALEENWMTPKADGRCGYAEWSWRKMKEDLEPQGVKF